MAKDDDKIADLFRWFDETIKEVEELFYDDEEEILDDDVMDFTSEYPSDIPLKKDGTPDMRFKISKEYMEPYVPSPEVLAGYEPKYAEEVEEEEEEEEEVWYAYFTRLGSGYWGYEFFDDVETVYYSQEEGREWEAEDRIVEDYGERYYGKDNEELGDADSGEKVPASEVKDDKIL